ncbi:MAG TPA: mechanosensitive ion channel domain-containing protein [Reyranella sp.]|nr:mechanosensitive ion channel domain-containing protein [Reyranella sp.]
MTAFLRLLTDRGDATWSQLPAGRDYLLGLAGKFDSRTILLLVGIMVAGLAAEWVARQLVVRVRHRIHAVGGKKTPLRALLQVMLLDGLALVALWAAGRIVLGQLGDPASMASKIGHQLLLAVLLWRGFNFVFRAWLRPNSPSGRLAPVDDATARRLLRALNTVIVLPLVARTIVQVMGLTLAPPAVISAAVICLVPLVGIGLVYAVWHWRHDMAAWFAGMVPEKDLFRPGKLALAHNWWVGGLIFYVASGVLAVYAALTQQGLANSGLGGIESLLIMLLLFETLVHKSTQHLPMEAPTVGELVASCIRLGVRLWVAVAIAHALIVGVLGMMSAAEWAPHDRAAKLAAISALAFFVAWRILKYRMDRYIADNPLPTAGFDPTADEDAPAAASRLRTIMPVLRATIGIAFLILGGLLVLSELGINTTPLIAGFSVLGLAVSFGSQSLVRDIVSGVFFLAEDSFRVGEYIDGTKVKGTVEGFSVRSIRLRHQNGQLHIVPFGQLTHITNFSRDWTTVKFNVAFALNTDAELLRKTAKKIGLEMMNEPQFQKELIQPPKMQGIVDIKDGSLIVRFKFTARPKNPSLIQRTMIRRMYDILPGLGIEFAKPPYAMMGLGGLAPAARAAAQ